jgi:hypothetical protein
MSNSKVVKMPSAPKTVDEVFKMCREAAAMQEQLLGQIMAFAPEKGAGNVSACLTNAQTRNMECIDWITHAVAHVKQGE